VGIYHRDLGILSVTIRPGGGYMAVDQARFEELTKKRDEEGLTTEEANELGRMIAEKEGKPYASADQVHAEEETGDTPVAWEAERAAEGDEQGVQEPPAETARPAGASAGGLPAEAPEEGRDPGDPGP
jgi:hypothetical protein